MCRWSAICFAARVSVAASHCDQMNCTFLYCCVFHVTIVSLVLCDLQEAAYFLQTREYAQLTSQQRLTIMRCLMDLALNADVLRDTISARVESLSNTRGR